MKITPAQWLEVMHAIKEDRCVALLEKMLEDAYEKGKEDQRKEGCQL